jgi:hypothetical protein
MRVARLRVVVFGMMTQFGACGAGARPLPAPGSHFGLKIRDQVTPPPPAAIEGPHLGRPPRLVCLPALKTNSRRQPASGGATLKQMSGGDRSTGAERCIKTPAEQKWWESIKLIAQFIDLPLATSSPWMGPTDTEDPARDARAPALTREIAIKRGAGLVWARNWNARLVFSPLVVVHHST